MILSRRLRGTARCILRVFSSRSIEFSPVSMNRTCDYYTRCTSPICICVCDSITRLCPWQSESFSIRRANGVYWLYNNMCAREFISKERTAIKKKYIYINNNNTNLYYIAYAMLYCIVLIDFVFVIFVYRAYEMSQESQSPLGQWNNKYSSVLATLGCTLGAFNISRFAILTVQFGG